MKFLGIDLDPELEKLMNQPEAKLGSRLIGMRTQKGLSQQRAAQILGKSRTDYVKMESGVLDEPLTEYKNALEKLATFIEIANGANDKMSEYTQYNMDEKSPSIGRTMLEFDTAWK